MCPQEIMSIGLLSDRNCELCMWLRVLMFLRWAFGPRKIEMALLLSGQRTVERAGAYYCCC